MFDRADLNLDDRISEDEYLSVRIPALNPDFMASLPAERQAMARRTIEPVTAKVRAVFQAWDADKDGYVTRQEMIPS